VLAVRALVVARPTAAELLPLVVVVPALGVLDRTIFLAARAEHYWVTIVCFVFAGNWIAALIRTRAGRRLDSPALIADGAHARADAYVSLAVIASAAVVALGVPIADPLIGLAITLVILRITWDSWRTVRGHERHH